MNTFISLDGVMQGPGGPQEDPTGGFAHGGWNVSFWDDVMAYERAGEVPTGSFQLDEPTEAQTRRRARLTR